MDKQKKISIVVSAYNEEAALPYFYEEISRVLRTIDWDYELIFVNDGSTDNTRAELYRITQKDRKAKAVHFSRNFGHEAAMIAGVDYSTGDGIICMDADLQHPPACIPAMLQAFDDGYDVISMVRTKNKDAGWLKNVTSSGFYAVINSMSPTKLEKNASDFFGISARAAAVLKKNYREKVRFLRGYVQSIGFQKKVIEYAAPDRVAGKSKYSIRKLFRFSMDTIMCFSDLPLKLGIYAGVFSGLLGLILLIYTIVTKISRGAPGGYATTIVVICFMFAVLFLIVGIIGEYIGILFAEIKDRPVYIVEETVNMEKDDDAGK
jgi:glycosyltransferase involved in cell wall biosynthesis